MFSRFPRPRQPLRAGARMRGAGAAGARGIRGRAAGEGCVCGGRTRTGKPRRDLGFWGFLTMGFGVLAVWRTGLGIPEAPGAASSASALPQPAQGRLCPLAVWIPDGNVIPKKVFLSSIKPMHRACYHPLATSKQEFGRNNPNFLKQTSSKHPVNDCGAIPGSGKSAQSLAARSKN